ncbi:MAG TPA: cation diffusion facilitator family transporter [Candidatus Polarisedimenticolia bacterium]|nr:cation diffusion facilitator family transporter [Candidatus Polarisedimenticolia bacterium]
MAEPRSESANPGPHGDRRTAAIRRVLWQVLLLNLLVAVAKLVYGNVTGAISMLADGLHSLMDSSSNIVGLVGTAVAARPPDPGHPYGHRKFEVISALGIVFLLGLACYEILSNSLTRLFEGGTPIVTPLSYVIMLLTMAVNGGVSVYEQRRGRALASVILVADSLHTRSDLFASMAVLIGLTGSRLGVAWLDPVAAIVVVLLIARVGYRIVVASLDVLADARVFHPEEIAATAMEVPGVIDCHDVRSRGLPDHVHVDFHLTVAPDTPTRTSHAIAHQVVDLIQERFPGVRDVTPHVEPPEDEEAGAAGAPPAEAP